MLLGQPIDAVVHDDIGQAEIFPGRVGEMVAADRECVPVAAKGEHMQVRPGHRNARGKRQRAAVNEMDPMPLDEIREPAGAANPGDGGDFLVPQFAFFDRSGCARF